MRGHLKTPSVKGQRVKRAILSWWTETYVHVLSCSIHVKSKVNLDARWDILTYGI